MLLFYGSLQLIKSTNHHSRKKRNTPHVRRRKKSEMINPFLDGTVENMRSCQIQTLYIDFKDLGWNVNIYLTLFILEILLTHHFTGLDHCPGGLWRLLLQRGMQFPSKCSHECHQSCHCPDFGTFVGTEKGAETLLCANTFRCFTRPISFERREC